MISLIYTTEPSSRPIYSPTFSLIYRREFSDAPVSLIQLMYPYDHMGLLRDSFLAKLYFPLPMAVSSLGLWKDIYWKSHGERSWRSLGGLRIRERCNIMVPPVPTCTCHWSEFLYAINLKPAWNRHGWREAEEEVEVCRFVQPNECVVQ
ncbi:hypothetical protein H6P81_018022 [Aristolochia fimbriata]|uniref:Uncharacterized protein n=1 Tax=Aristolochia fimbriata TaxID=158543 RepID=A0AAV7E0L7_ARIFI|nr:hypothetical protein H6P81_018022 [Aristolochia fimbriata]